MSEKNKRRLPLKVDPRYLLREAKNFETHKKGIPEWLKNSDDSYTRHEELRKSNFKDFPIIVNFSRNEICCLDFGGANAKAMIEHIPFYGNPDAAAQGEKISKVLSGGHGNGGKYYALSQFKQCKILSYYKKKITILKLEDAYFDVLEEDREVLPTIALKSFEIEDWGYFKTKGKNILDLIKNGNVNLFCWKGINPKDKMNLIKRRELSQLLIQISNNPQARSTLRSRQITILHNGELFEEKLCPGEVEIDENYGVKEFALPNNLSKYKFNTQLKSTLKICLSKSPLINDRSALNILEIDSNGKNIAYYNLPTIMMDKGISKYLYAYIDCPELKEYGCVTNDRVSLVDSEISDIFLKWCMSKIQEVLDDIFNKEKRISEQKDLTELGGFLNKMAQEVIPDLLIDDNIIVSKFDNQGQKKELVDVITEEPGYGGSEHSNTPGNGKRKGGTEKKEEKSSDHKSKSPIRILLSNHDKDPLHPEKTFDMIEREPILYQRPEDIDHGIWWINTQKRYTKKIKINDPGAMPFWFFVIKEIVFSHKIRRKFKEQDGYEPDGIETVNFYLIDEIFSKITDRLGIELSSENNSQLLRQKIQSKDKFTVKELSEELNISENQIHVFLNNPANNVMLYFTKEKKTSNKGAAINQYIRK